MQTVNMVTTGAAKTEKTGSKASSGSGDFMQALAALMGTATKEGTAQKQAGLLFGTMTGGAADTGGQSGQGKEQSSGQTADLSLLALLGMAPQLLGMAQPVQTQPASTSGDQSTGVSSDTPAGVVIPVAQGAGIVVTGLARSVSTADQATAASDGTEGTARKDASLTFVPAQDTSQATATHQTGQDPFQAVMSQAANGQTDAQPLLSVAKMPSGADAGNEQRTQTQAGGMRADDLAAFRSSSNNAATSAVNQASMAGKANDAGQVQTASPNIAAVTSVTADTQRSHNADVFTGNNATGPSAVTTGADDAGFGRVLSAQAGAQSKGGESAKEDDGKKKDNTDFGSVNLVGTKAAQVTGTDDTATVKTNTAELARQISDAAKQAADSGKSEIHIHLSPEDLGGINIKIVSQNGTLSLQISADNRHTGAMLASNMTELNRSMSDSGVSMSKVEIFYAGTGGFDSSQAGGQQYAGSHSNQTAAWRPIETSGNDAAETEPVEDGRMSLLA